ncbi:MAG: hypothetical protein IJO63_03290 [Bacilli bacterium]|nr:hypothetical protein [Bacilli bacterium]
MDSHIVADFKLTLATLDQIVKENKDNSELIEACKVAVKTVKKAIRQQNAYAASIDEALLENELFGLYRTRVSLNLIRDADKYGDNTPAIQEALGMVIEEVEGKIESLKEGKVLK